jgi:hypothetical protein
VFCQKVDLLSKYLSRLTIWLLHYHIFFDIAKSNTGLRQSQSLATMDLYSNLNFNLLSEIHDPWNVCSGGKNPKWDLSLWNLFLIMSSFQHNTIQFDTTRYQFMCNKCFLPRPTKKIISVSTPYPGTTFWPTHPRAICYHTISRNNILAHPS